MSCSPSGGRRAVEPVRSAAAPDACGAIRSASPRIRTARGPCRPSRSTKSDCPGSRHCCCRPACGPSSSPATSIGTPCASSSVASSARCSRPRNSQHRRIGGGTFDAAIDAAVVVVAVGVGLRRWLRCACARYDDQVGQREAVVRGDEIDARLRHASAVPEQIARAGEARGEFAAAGTDRVQPEAARGVAKAVVPFARCPAGKRPVSQVATSHGSAISLTPASTGSWRSVSRNAQPGSKPPPSRASAVARSKRKPSTCISLTHQRSESITICSTRGCATFSVLPQPVTSS